MNGTEDIRRANHAGLKKYLGDNKHLVVELKKFLKEAEAAGDVHYIGKLNMHIAGCYFDLGNRVKILPYALKAVSIFENSDNRSLLARSYNILGIAYHAQGKYQLSIEAYNKALEAIRGLKKPGIGRDLMLNNTACMIASAWMFSIAALHDLILCRE